MVSIIIISSFHIIFCNFVCYEFRCDRLPVVTSTTSTNKKKYNQPQPAGQLKPKPQFRIAQLKTMQSPIWLINNYLVSGDGLYGFMAFNCFSLCTQHSRVTHIHNWINLIAQMNPFHCCLSFSLLTQSKHIRFRTREPFDLHRLYHLVQFSIFNSFHI